MNEQVQRPLWLKITGCGFAAVLLASLSIGGLSFYRQYQAGEDDLRDEVVKDTAAIQADMAAQQRAAAGVALAVAGEPELGDLIEAHAKDKIIDRYKRNFDQIRSNSSLQLMTISDAASTAVARVHQPDVSGDDLSSRRKTIGQAVKTGVLQAGLEPGRTSLSVFASAPVVTKDHVVGVVDVGTGLTTDYFARLKTAVAADIAVAMLRDGKFETQNSTFADKPPLSDTELQAIYDGTSPVRLVESAGKAYAVSGAALSDFSGKRIGVLEVASDVTPIVAARRSALLSTALATATLCGVVLIAFLIFAKSLAGAIGRLTAVMGRLASGQLDVEVPDLGRKDEIGAMAQAVQVFRAAGLENVRLTAAAAEARLKSEAEQAANAAEREAVAREQDGVVSAIGDALDRLANGDLTFRLRQAFPPQYRKLGDDFNRAIAALQDTMGSVIEAAGSIRSGTGEISQAADDLSQRTERQAASLEETAAALDEITATVGKTADGASRAYQTVVAAQADAQQSGQVVKGAIDAMAEIERSSKAIGEIIGVIDEIAFQTNLLALNAGVEAARAGESGRGFAVVASEVRALAQRSAEAAKQIKTLISASSTQVEAGVDLVGQAADALKRISAQVTDISTVVAEITASAREQATGLKEVNTAVNQMDQVTQQNAAMVEESTAASRTLSQETEGLARLIGRFKVEAGSRHGGADHTGLLAA